MTIVLLTVVVGAFLYAGGCSKSDKEGPKAGQAAAASVQLCTACGQIKGSDVCCKPDAAKCPGCGLAKGSPGCCKLPKS